MENKPPSPEATYERSKRLANYWMWTISLQHRRLKTAEPEDEEFLFRKWVDFDFLIVALTRFRRAVSIATKVESIEQELDKAIEEFDKALPKIKKMRDVAEHVDDYALENQKNKQHKVSRKMLEGSILHGTELEWLNVRLNADEALKASEKLFEVLKQSQQLV